LAAEYEVNAHRIENPGNEQYAEVFGFPISSAPFTVEDQLFEQASRSGGLQTAVRKGGPVWKAPLLVSAMPGKNLQEPLQDY
jgi:hypothetical protein